MPGQKRDQRLKVTSSEHRHCGIFVGAARQTREDCCRSRRCHASLLPFADADALSAFWLHAQLFDVELPDYGRGMILVDAARDLPFIGPVTARQACCDFDRSCAVDQSSPQVENT